MIEPHGGKLVYRVDESIDTADAVKMKISQDMAKEVENIAHGVFSPLEGFMNRNDFESVLENMRLENNIPWTIPIVFDFENGIEEGDSIILEADDGTTALFEVEDIYTYDKKRYAEKVFGTTDIAHPGVERVMNMKSKLAGGKITLIKEGEDRFKQYYLKPMETREAFRNRGWDEIVAFQTRNVPHIGHEYVQKTALTFVDGLFINPIIGKKKKGDFRDDVILRAYEALIKNYYPQERVMMSTLRTMMRYAGPKEAIFHAIMRKNFGCTHFIVGRDHAGVGNYYGPYDAHEIFKEFPDLGIKPVFFRSFFYCKKCGGVVNDKICPHGEEEHIYFSGTAIRKMLVNKETPPPTMMREEVANIIMEYENPFVD